MKNFTIQIGEQVAHIETNLTQNQIRSAYIKGKAELGIEGDIILDLTYPTIEKEILSVLKESRFQFKNRLERYTPNHGESWHTVLPPEELLNIYTFIVKIGNPNFVYKDLSHNVIEVDL